MEKAGLVKLLYEARRWVYRITPDGITFLNDNRRSGQPPDAS
jgi:DNA-binding PadR family transcriptional regulator